MSSWRFSWRAILAWLGASVVSGLVFGLVLALCNAWADVTGRDAATFLDVIGVLGGGAAVFFSVVGGLLLLLLSFFARLPRPLAEAIVLAVAFALATTVGGVSIDLTAPEGVVRPDEHPGAFIVAYIAPAAAGVLMALLYRRLAGQRGGR